MNLTNPFEKMKMRRIIKAHISIMGRLFSKFFIFGTFYFNPAHWKKTAIPWNDIDVSSTASSKVWMSSLQSSKDNLHFWCVSINVRKSLREIRGLSSRSSFSLFLFSWMAEMYLSMTCSKLFCFSKLKKNRRNSTYCRLSLEFVAVCLGLIIAF